MTASQMQTAILQTKDAARLGELPLTSTSTAPLPTATSPYHVLVRVRAVALNPNDHKMVANFCEPGSGAGCDFCGIVVEAPDRLPAGQANGDSAQIDVGPPAAAASSQQLPLRPGGARVCGTVFPYAADHANGGENSRTGAFAEYVVADSRLLLRVPEDWTDLQGAALGGVGWSTVILAMSSPDALGLPGLPSKPAETRLPVLVYGGGTATGTMACQLLRLSGYAPIAVTHSTRSTELAKQCGAAGVASYTDADMNGCLDAVRTLSAEMAPLRHALDCVTDAESAAFCFAALARTGGRYVCLEEFRSAWRTRRVVKVKEVMGYEVLGRRVELGGPGLTYSRDVNEPAAELGRTWAVEMQSLLNNGLVHAHPIQPIEGDGSGTSWTEKVVSGLETLRRGGVRGKKLVARVSEQ